MPAGSLSIAGIPEFRGSSAAARYRKSSVTDPIRRPTLSLSGDTKGDLLLDPITVSQLVNLGNHIDIYPTHILTTLPTPLFEGPVENVRRCVLLHPGEDPLIFTEMMSLEFEESGYIWRQSARNKQTISADIYGEQLRKLAAAAQRKRPKRLILTLLQYNARLHNAKPTSHILERLC
ncbi:hypothetical protein KIN20_024207 [Parelaphostrongylus tenuis]|uniref:Uncharacterized protein n=1 Tax=Parelaphostrongylus tenuis TaxID=148309 RepID=A0AAD5QW66_PARTN|nr:hypothetical protein KIN20_024207 [Parelaphostrongylus tenuis]